MTKPDRSDDDDFYDQGFDRKGFVSVWAGKIEPRLESEIDVLQDLCGVGYYRLSDQEGNNFDFEEVPLQALLKDVSYSKSFTDNVLQAAEKKGVFQARWVVLQYDFHYDPTKVTRQIADDPIFIGAFPFTTEDKK